jgi:probable F420-dependent oxidoreductase
LNEIGIGFVTGASREEVEALEALPIDSLWVGGHVAAPNPVPEALVQLARVAALTRRVRVGTSILLLPLYPPAIVAKQVADLDHVTGGRVTLGVGVGGEYPSEFRACGVPLQERGRRVNEAIPLIRRLWTGEEISHSGPFYSMEGVRIHPAPVQSGGPPIVVAGRKDPAMVRAARLGNGWMPYLYSPRAYAESVRRIKEIATEANRDLAGFQWMQFLFVNVQDDLDRAQDETANYLGGPFMQDFRPLVDRVTAAGTPEQVAARIREYVSVGVQHIVFATATRGDKLAMARRILFEVMPKVCGSMPPG